MAESVLTPAGGALVRPDSLLSHSGPRAFAPANAGLNVNARHLNVSVTGSVHFEPEPPIDMPCMSMFPMFP